MEKRAVIESGLTPEESQTCCGGKCKSAEKSSSEKSPEELESHLTKRAEEEARKSL